MARPAMPPDICHEIALLATPYTVATLSLLCRAYSVGLRRVLYRTIIVGDRADNLVRTLASDKWTASMVQSLVFEDSFCAYIDDADWERAVTTLVNLRHLTITHHVPLSWDSLPLISFRLRSFTALGLVIGPWAAFLHRQPELEEIVFHSDLLAAPPGPDALPVLRRLSARPSELSKFALVHPLESMVFWVGAPWGVMGLQAHDLVRFRDSACRLRTLRVNCSQLFVLFRDASQMLKTLKHLAIDEDHAWSRNSTAEQRLLMRAAAAIDEQHAPVLQSLTMVCNARPRARLNSTDRAVSIERADAFSLAMRVKCTAPALGTFHFCAADTCRTWQQWGQKDETIQSTRSGWIQYNILLSQSTSHCDHLQHMNPQERDLILEELFGPGATGPTQSISSYAPEKTWTLKGCYPCAQGTQRFREPSTRATTESMADTPIGTESAQRLQAALDSVPAAAEEMWQSAMQDLEQWVKDFPPLDPPPLLNPESRVAPSSDPLMNATAERFLEGDAWGRSGRTDGEGIESGWIAHWSAGRTDAEGVESRWATDQWINVLGMATRAMREPERREMLDEEYRRDQWLQQHRERRRRAWRTTGGARDLARARESVQREVDVELRRREGWALTFHDVTGLGYIE
ncbi:hypothetical protein DFH09DRAFT_1336740 [Mycena vulgaris]|nr:hypothetical protein DFH09DRAFT_1336740 [Mycena vulgaris]